MAGETRSGPGFKVLKIDELTRIADEGGIERYYRHTIRTSGGTILRVDIDAADFTPDRVRLILTERATNADKILGI